MARRGCTTIGPGTTRRNTLDSSQRIRSGLGVGRMSMRMSGQIQLPGQILWDYKVAQIGPGTGHRHHSILGHHKP